MRTTQKRFFADPSAAGKRVCVAVAGIGHMAVACQTQAGAQAGAQAREQTWALDQRAQQPKCSFPDNDDVLYAAAA